MWRCPLSCCQGMSSWGIPRFHQRKTDYVLFFTDMIREAGSKAERTEVAPTGLSGIWYFCSLDSHTSRRPSRAFEGWEWGSLTQFSWR